MDELQSTDLYSYMRVSHNSSLNEPVTHLVKAVLTVDWWYQ